MPSQLHAESTERASESVRRTAIPRDRSERSVSYLPLPILASLNHVVILVNDVTAAIAPVQDMVNKTTSRCSGCSWHQQRLTVATNPCKVECSLFTPPFLLPLFTPSRRAATSDQTWLNERQHGDVDCEFPPRWFDLRQKSFTAERSQMVLLRYWGVETVASLAGSRSETDRATFAAINGCGRLRFMSVQFEVFGVGAGVGREGLAGHLAVGGVARSGDRPQRGAALREVSRRRREVVRVMHCQLLRTLPWSSCDSLNTADRKLDTFVRSR